MYKEEDLFAFIPMFDALLNGENVEFENYILQLLKFAQTEPFLKLVNEYRRSICLAPIDLFRFYLIPSLKELISDGVVGYVVCCRYIVNLFNIFWLPSDAVGLHASKIRNFNLEKF